MFVNHKNGYSTFNTEGNEATKAGIRLAKLLNLRKNSVGRYDTSVKDKTAAGLARTVLRCLQDPRQSIRQPL